MSSFSRIVINDTLAAAGQFLCASTFEHLITVHTGFRQEHLAAITDEGKELPITLSHNLP